MKITVISYHSPEYRDMLVLRYKILREPWGLNFSDTDLQQEKDDVFIACYEAGQIIGCCILTEKTPEIVKLRQMAVETQWQGKDVGMFIVAFAEQYAVEHSYSKIILHARQTACGFYAKCGYSVVDDIFLELGIPHFFMEKNLH